jgi:hypothetical protein
MTRFLYGFGYETPRQYRLNSQMGWDDEDSLAILIEADDEGAALNWGREVSEKFVKQLYQDDTVSWKGLGYASWIESSSREPSSTLPLIRLGEFPDFAQWLRED